jgi:hypothetical protein
VLGRYRWLLWWMPGSENRPMRFNANPFYGEFDVFAAPEEEGSARPPRNGEGTVPKPR